MHQTLLQLNEVSIASCNLAQLIGYFFTAFCVRAETIHKSERFQMGVGRKDVLEKKGGGKQKKTEVKGTKRNKQIFHRMSSRPEDNDAAATCNISLRTAECPDTPTLHLR